MLHIHFGAGRLGLGLVGPAFKKDGSELFLLNRAISGSKATGSTSLSAERRNELLRDGAGKRYFIEKPGGVPEDRTAVTYDDFIIYDDENLEREVEQIVEHSSQVANGVVVSASILAIENYGPVIETLNLLAKTRAKGGEIGKIYLVACENTLSAPAVFKDHTVAPAICEEAFEHVTCVHALVDRMCVGLEEINADDGPAVLVRAEDYGSLKLELKDDDNDLVELCRGSKIEFSRHVDTEKQIKSWLLNGTHWLIALEAFEETRGDQNMKLNEFLLSDPRHMEFARKAMREMQEGVAILLRGGDRFRAFVEDVDVDQYLEGAAAAILRRFCSTEDPITRILARFRAPTADSVDTIVSFSKRFADRVDEPMQAYEARKGFLPPAASRGVLSLMRLVANGTFITAAAA
ncbi:MAG TPA: hypothetical protein VF637_14975 [Sphingomicrobium sp.]